MKKYTKPSISIDNLYTEKALANDYFFSEDDMPAGGQEVELSTSGWWDLFGLND